MVRQTQLLQDPSDLVERELMDPSLVQGEADDADGKRRGRWPKELSRLVAAMERAFVRRGMRPEEAAELAAEGALAMAEDRGGRMVYLPTGKALRAELRALTAWRMFRGDNVEEIAGYLGVSTVHAYAVLKRMRKLHQDRIQRPLFPAEGR